MAPLLPKLRGYFAEFLRESCLAPLSILYQSTCVGLGTGLFNSLEDFLGKKVLLTQQTMAGSAKLSSSLVDYIKTRYGNICPLSIDYAFRPRLRS